MPWKDPNRRREVRRQQYAEHNAAGLIRDWGHIVAVCPGCQIERTVSKNSHRITQYPQDDQGRILKRCRACSKRKEYATYSDPVAVRDIQRQKRQQQKIRAIQYLGSQCQRCTLRYDGTNGYAFDFHHKERKDFTISSKYYGWAKLQPELDKCSLLCAICHRAEHSEQY